MPVGELVTNPLPRHERQKQFPPSEGERCTSNVGDHGRIVPGRFQQGEQISRQRIVERHPARFGSLDHSASAIARADAAATMAATGDVTATGAPSGPDSSTLFAGSPHSVGSRRARNA